MPQPLAGLLRAFRDGRGAEVWSDFLDQAGGLLLQVARSVNRDADDAADAFVFVCEQLVAKDFARLRQFDLEGPARPETWLRAVARNLCVDRYRARKGRPRVFEAIARLPELEQLVFKWTYRNGLTLHEALEVLRQERPHLALDAVAAAHHRVTVALGPRQLLALTADRPRLYSLDESDPSLRGAADVPSPDPSPETQFRDGEQRRRTRAALSRLSPEDRLAVQLRFERQLSLAEVARLLGLKDHQQADRRLRSILRALREDVTGNAKAPSV
jgi:RNA polymerase sigma factor (sigma-70 family)